MPRMHGATIRPSLPGATARLRACGWPGCLRADVRVGSSSDLTALKFDFRSSPESELKSDIGHVRSCQKQTNAAWAFPMLDGSIEFGDKPCQVRRGPRTGFAQTLKNAYPFGTRRCAGIRESGAR